ncbi:MAG: hypothetical protein QOE85_1096, partial [Actinomycetota bacterium]|nr:hypothetical protein [Actinomycetota bacterium]
PGNKQKLGLIAALVAMWREGGASRNRIVVWIVAGAFGFYLIITGVVGIITKAR